MIITQISSLDRDQENAEKQYQKKLQKISDERRRLQSLLHQELDWIAAHKPCRVVKVSELFAQSLAGRDDIYYMGEMSNGWNETVYEVIKLYNIVPIMAGAISSVVGLEAEFEFTKETGLVGHDHNSRQTLTLEASDHVVVLGLE